MKTGEHVSDLMMEEQFMAKKKKHFLIFLDI